MRKSVIMSFIMFFAIIMSGISQSNNGGPQNRTTGIRNAIKPGNVKCKKLKKRHMKSMRRMAAADGQVTPREKRMLKRERRRIN